MRSTSVLTKNPTRSSSASSRAAGDRRADRDVRAGAEPGQQRRERGLQHHEQASRRWLRASSTQAAVQRPASRCDPSDRRRGSSPTAGRGRSVGSSSCSGMSASARASRRAGGRQAVRVVRRRRAARAARARSRRTAPAAAATPGAVPRGAPRRRRRGRARSGPIDQPSLAMWCATSSSTCSSGPARSSRARSGSSRRDRTRRPRAPRRVGGAASPRRRRSATVQQARRRSPARGSAGGTAARRRRDGAQRLVPGDDVARARLAARPRRARRSAAARAACCTSSSALELVEEPQPLLRVRQRQRPGRRAGRERRARPAPASAVTCRASAATVGASNRSRTLSSAPSARRTRLTSRVASSEWPPSAKKSSSTPTSSTPRTSANRPQRISSCGVARRAAAPAAVDLRARAGRGGRACRSASAAARPARRTPTAPCSPAAARQRSAQRRQVGSRRRRHDVGDQALLAPAGPRATTTAACAHRGCCAQRGLDLAELDPEAADLDLVVGAAEELQLAVGAPAHEVAGAVHPRPGPPNGSATNRSAVRPGRPR